MSSQSQPGIRHQLVGTRKSESNGVAAPTGARPSDRGPVPRVRSDVLLNNGLQLIIEHAGREYCLRVTSNGKLILTA